MDFKYKIADVAKDFGITAKRAIDTVAALTGETRRYPRGERNHAGLHRFRVRREPPPRDR